MTLRWSKRGFPPKGGVSRLRSLAPILASVAALLVGLTLGACGGGSNSADVPPHSTPEITPPASTQAESEATPTTSTSTVATTSKSSSGSTSSSEKSFERRTVQLQLVGGHGQRKHDQPYRRRGGKSKHPGSKLGRERRHWRKRSQRRLGSQRRRLFGQPHRRRPGSLISHAFVHIHATEAFLDQAGRRWPKRGCERSECLPASVGEAHAGSTCEPSRGDPAQCPGTPQGVEINVALYVRRASR